MKTIKAAVDGLVRKCGQGKADAYDMGRLRGLTSFGDLLRHGEDVALAIRLAGANVRDDYDAGYLAGRWLVGGRYPIVARPRTGRKTTGVQRTRSSCHRPCN